MMVNAPIRPNGLKWHGLLKNFLNRSEGRRPSRICPEGMSGLQNFLNREINAVKKFIRHMCDNGGERSEQFERN
ncbi:hypothetical protein Glove_320g142 [Diversispora epigaea]|uniref:Uncharacterized protein n=1 Tax=Diversispora epigaea TaxID=1348612 RepID=A0A397HUI5_9GLOM|nr:hypothetical protein Glove_320g142 [Diversispora epigaea]